MGKFYFSADYFLGLLCAAALAFPSLASAGRVSVDVYPTTGYTVTKTETFALPPRSTSTGMQTYKPELGPLAGGGAYQTMRSGITIIAIEEKGQTLSSIISSRLRATAGAMKNGAARCFTSFRCNLALMAGAAGIESFIDGIGWIIDEGGNVTKKMPPPPQLLPDCPVGATCGSAVYSGGFCSPENPDLGRPYCFNLFSNLDECNDRGYGPCYLYVNPNPSGSSSVVASYYPLFINQPLAPLIATFAGAEGQIRGYYANVSEPAISGPTVAVPRSEIPAMIDRHYTPDPSDLPFLASGGLDFSHDGVDVEIIDIPSVTGADSPNYVEYSDGTSKGTYSEYEFTWGGPSKQPEISVSEKTTETTYDQTGAVSGVTVSGGTSSGSSANNPPEIPTDCDFMPTVCRFIDWFTEPDPELSQDADFSQLIDDVDIERDFSVGSSTASCPAPFVVQLQWVPSVEVSLQPFCDFADLLRPVLLALAWLVSGMIVLRT